MRRTLIVGLFMGLTVLFTGACSGTSNNSGLSHLRDLAPDLGADCHPAPDPSRAQYIIGYGSYLQQASRQRTMPAVTDVIPIELRGYRRGFFAEGKNPGFNTVYLGTVPDPEGELNAVVFPVTLADVAASDDRETDYCRALVPLEDVTVLDGPPLVAAGQVWMYENTTDSIALPSADEPIVQSYVDIFVSGCLEVEEQHSLPGFAERCIATTTDWSKHWVNDRQSPRRPSAQQPRAVQIDRLLKAGVPTQFAAIRIE